MSHCSFLSIQILFNVFDTSVMILMKVSISDASFSLQMCVFVFPFTQDVFSVTKEFNIQICDQLFAIIYMVHGWIIHMIMFVFMCFYIIFAYHPFYIPISTFDHSSTPSCSSYAFKI